MKHGCNHANAVRLYVVLFSFAWLQPLPANAANPFKETLQLPIKLNTFYGLGDEDKTRAVMTTQPMWSTPLNAEWDIIWRGGIRLVSQPGFEGADRTWGLGDTSLAAFFTPVNSGSLLWGMGPSILLPTASDDRLGQEKYAVGPTAVFLNSGRKGHVGVFTRNVWSIAGNDARKDINRFLFQPLLKYKLSDGWFVNSNPAITANWDAPAGERWTVPVGAGIGRTFKIGGIRTTFSLQYYHMIERRQNAPEWMTRANLTFSIPR